MTEPNKYDFARRREAAERGRQDFNVYKQAVKGRLADRLADPRIGGLGQIAKDLANTDYPIEQREDYLLELIALGHGQGMDDEQEIAAGRIEGSDYLKTIANYKKQHPHNPIDTVPETI